LNGSTQSRAMYIALALCSLRSPQEKRRVLFPREGHSTYIHEYARELWTGGRSVELIDPQLPSEHHINEILRCFQIGLLCVEKNCFDRPSMRDALLIC
ncbi:hypothetical protein BAE44_0018815, partial [Dichanthelium oligosanthes]